jgi:hypothetical protein
MLQTEIEQRPPGPLSISIFFACGKFGESFKARGGYVPLLCSFSMPGAPSWPPDVCLSSLPVMAWRHPDVCNRHQKSQAREDLACILREDAGYFLGVLWEVVAKLVAQT